MKKFAYVAIPVAAIISLVLYRFWNFTEGSIEPIFFILFAILQYFMAKNKEEIRVEMAHKNNGLNVDETYYFYGILGDVAIASISLQLFFIFFFGTAVKLIGSFFVFVFSLFVARLIFASKHGKDVKRRKDMEIEELKKQIEKEELGLK